MGCLLCQQTQKCVINDDVESILNKVKSADAIVFAMPIYYYEMSGQMKTLLDRLNPLFPSDYNFRDIYMIATAADENEKAADIAVKGLEGWIECFDKAKLSGVLLATGVTAVGDLDKHENIIRKAYEKGLSI
jgi:multimeric flavodoxin WrbA